MIKERKDIESCLKWDLSAIYADEESFNADFAIVETSIKEFVKFEKIMCKNAQGLYDTLCEMTRIESVIEKLWQYAHLNFSIDSSNNTYQALTARVRSLAVSAGESSWFVSPYLLRLDESVLNNWFDEFPELETFRRMIEKNMRMKPYTLSDECEKLMSKMEDVLGTHDETRNLFANSDLRFGKIKNEAGEYVELTDAGYVPFLMSNDRSVRRSAFRCLYKTYEQFGNTFGVMLGNHIKEQCTVAKIRKYPNSLTASVFHDEVSPEIYNNLIDSVNNRLTVLYDYYDLKKEVLGLENIHMYDIYAPLIGDLDRIYTYDEAVDEVLKTVEVYGDEYSSNLRAGLKEKGWVDVYPSRGKHGGAFSSGCPGIEPYILLNYTEKFDDMMTLAHEAGHSMHTWFSTHYNEPYNSSYTIFVAEVASTVNELLLAHRKLKECQNDTEKLYILNQLMETYKGTLFRQTMFAEFEKTMHSLYEKGEPLTADVINKNYYRLVKKYFGKGVVCDKQISYEWMRIPHFYTSFYVYKYATCISAASAIVKRIETEKENYVDQYINFLKCGDSFSPLDSLRVAGIDMTKPEIVSEAIDDFENSVSQFREIYKKHGKA